MTNLLQTIWRGKEVLPNVTELLAANYVEWLLLASKAAQYSKLLTWWKPGRPPESTGLSDGSTAISWMSGFCLVR